MKNVFVVIGRTGAGKTTLCKSLEEQFHFPLLSFASMGKKFANAQGYERIRQCHLAMPLEKFKDGIANYMLEVIDKELEENDVLLLDGVYVDVAIASLKQKYNCKVIYLKVEENIRYERIAKRLSVSIEQAKEENAIKERLKDDVGIAKLLEEADFVLDGMLSFAEKFQKTKAFIEQSIL